VSTVDRFGEPLEEPPEDEQSPAPQAEEPCGCDSGWLDYVDAEHPTPCPRCKPHLAGPRVYLH
jgi:hypothetical protein